MYGEITYSWSFDSTHALPGVPVVALRVPRELSKLTVLQARKLWTAQAVGR